MADEADQADQVIAHNLSIALAAIRAQQNDSSGVDVQVTVCGDCDYAGASYGVDCGDWQSCLADCRKYGLLR